jgi:hypothetical protein
MNLIEAAEKLGSMLQQLLKSSTVDSLPSARKVELEGIGEKIKVIVADLKAVDQSFLDLRRSTEEKKNLAKNLAYWENLPAGAIRAGTPGFDELRENSKTISDLHRAAIDISQIIKFGPNALSFASAMGTNFQRFQESWQRFKTLIADHQDLFETDAGRVLEAAGFFRELKRFGVVSDYSTAFRKDRRWIEADISRLKQIRDPDVRVGFRFGFVEGRRGLITGHWFNAYAYEVLSDQLKRLEADFEIYPLVSYRASGNVALARGEIDVVARIGSQILVIECKSGRIRRDVDIDMFEMIRQKFDDLKHIFASARLSNFTFVLVFNPFLVDPQQVTENFDNKGIISIGIDDLRGKIIDLTPALSKSAN